ncbi:dipeptidyl-peptidase 3 family protein [Thalassotalea piscium]
MKKTTLAMALLIATTALSGCNDTRTTSSSTTHELLPEYSNRLDIYQTIKLSTDLSHLTKEQRQMIGLLIEASDIMDDLFWKQAFGDNKAAFLASIKDDKVREFTKINYGPWDRLNGDKPFLTDTPAKQPGAQFYPADMTKDEFQASDFNDKKGLYSLVKRNEQGELSSIAFSEAYSDELNRAAVILEKAATLAKDKEFSSYLKMRATALRTDDYQASDFAWMDMKNNLIDIVIGPIETYEDQLFGYRAAFESYVLIKDLKWSEKLAKYAAFLPELQKGLPVEQKYKNEVPGSDADLNAYDVVYYAGHSNAGSKTIAINLPNDEKVQLEKGTRRLQLKNAMRAKYDAILVPIAEQLIVPEQRKHVTFNAFFANTMFHEVAHGLGIKNTLTDKGTVRQALKEHASALEEGKADILGLYMIRQLLNKGVIEEGVLADYYTTFLAGIFRSVRFGASSAHGKANMVRFNYFAEQGAFDRNEAGFYSVNMDKMGLAIDGLSKTILTLQGNGDYDGVSKLVAEKGVINPNLQTDLAKLTSAEIPVDIVFEQGKKTLGL